MRGVHEVRARGGACIRGQFERASLLSRVQSLVPMANQRTHVSNHLNLHFRREVYNLTHCLEEHPCPAWQEEIGDALKRDRLCTTLPFFFDSLGPVTETSTHHSPPMKANEVGSQGTIWMMSKRKEPPLKCPKSFQHLRLEAIASRLEAFAWTRGPRVVDFTESVVHLLYFVRLFTSYFSSHFVKLSSLRIC